MKHGVASENAVETDSV